MFLEFLPYYLVFTVGLASVVLPVVYLLTSGIKKAISDFSFAVSNKDMGSFHTNHTESKLTPGDAPMLKTAALLFSLTTSTLALASPPIQWTYGKAQGIQTPESVYFDAGTSAFYVANIVGEGTAKDGQGWISKISRDGKTLDAKWVHGLNAPKGMRIAKGKLWVADIDELVEIDLKKAKILARHSAEGAKFLNDVAIADDGAVYVSDTVGGKIYRHKNKKTVVFMEGADLEAPNGLLVEGGTLYVAAWGTGLKADWSVTTPGGVYSVDLKSKKRKVVLAAPVGNLDGLERHPGGGFLLSDWVAGKVLRADKDGKTQEIVTGLKGAADIGFDAKNKLLVVPAMGEDRVNAYLVE